MATTNFPNGVSSFGVPVLPPAGQAFTGKVFFVAPGAANASDGGTVTAATSGIAVNPT